MLQRLHIRHLLLLEDCQVDFSPALNVLSGESGAGKSLILQALALSMGTRFDHQLLSTGQKGGSVTALWQLPNDHAVWPLLAARGIIIDPEDGLVIRRQFGQPSGVYLNDAPVTLKTLHDLTPLLLEVYGQFAAHRLAEPDYQRHLVDDFGHLSPLVQQITTCYARWQDIAHILQQAQADATRLEERADYVAHVLEELHAENIVAGEWEQLEQQRHEARSHTLRLTQIHSALSMMQKAGLSRQLDQIQITLGVAADDNDDAEELIPIIDGLERAGIELAEAERTLEQLHYIQQQSQWDLEAIEQRLFRFAELGRKHQVAPENLPAVTQALEQEAQQAATSRQELLHLQQEHDALTTTLHDLCAKLHQQRAQAAQEFCRVINAELPNLNMAHAAVDIPVTWLDAPSTSGQDRVQFLLRTQPDAENKPLLKVASGGELSRVLLAIALGLGQGKSSISGMSLVLDEVDAGMGGETAAILGGRLQFLGSKRQIIAVTHSPQVAAQADHHLKVSKKQQTERFLSDVTWLQGDSRREEIARMLAGETITDAARQAADALLD